MIGDPESSGAVRVTITLSGLRVATGATGYAGSGAVHILTIFE